MKGCRCNQRRAAGFTLVEVLVALMAMALLSSLSWLALDGVMRSRDAGRDAIDNQVRLLTVLTQWEQDLQALHTTGLVPALEFDGQALRLTRRTDDGVAVVSWALRGGSWQRWMGAPCTRAADLRSSLGRSRQLLGNETGQLVVARGAADWQLHFFRGGAWSHAQSSGDLQVPTASSTASPAAAASSAGTADTAVAANPGGSAGSSSAPPAFEQLPDAVRLVISLNGHKLTRTVLLGPTGS